MTISKKKVIQNMTELGIYKPEFDTMIGIYVELVKQYNQLEKKFKISKYEAEEKTGYADNNKKSPIVSSLENLRKDILKYANELGLTPAGLKKINEKELGNKRKSHITEAIKNIGQ